MSQIFEQNWVISATVSVVRILINYSKDDDEKSVPVLFTTVYLVFFYLVQMFLLFCHYSNLFVPNFRLFSNFSCMFLNLKKKFQFELF